MNPAAPAWNRIRFGPFQVDRIRGELRKHGVRIRLQDQPFRILVLLLDHPGEVVPREELRQHLWPDGTFVDYEHSLNAALAKLRQALSDSSHTPRFIETIPRRGYRFVASADRLDASEAAKPALPEPADAAPSVPRSPSVGRRIAAAVAALLVVLGVGAALVFRRHPPKENPLLTRVTADTGLTKDPAISPDGKLIAYASDRNDSTNLDIWVQHISQGAHPLRLTANGADEHQPSFSPDGTEIVYRSEQEGGGIYRVPITGGNPMLLAKGGRDPQFSPDGAWVAYWTGKAIASTVGAGAAGPHALFVTPTQGWDPAEVQTDLREAGQPIWSKDGKHLIVYGSRGTNTDLPMGSLGITGDWWVVPLGGGPATQTGALEALRKQGMDIAYPSPIPRPAAWIENAIVFSARVRGSTNLWSLSLSPADWQAIPPARRLTIGSAFETTPSASRGGTIAFASIALNSNIWAIPLAANEARVTGPIRRITNGAWFDSSPSITPDGRLVAYDSIRSSDGKETIWMKDLETGREILLAKGQHGRHPEISKDGKRVVYTTIEGGGFVAPADGGAPEKFCNEECAYPWDWSPDGGSVVVSNRPSTSRQLDLFDFRLRKKHRFLMGTPYGVFQGRLSPDGRWLAFVSLAPSSADCTVYITPVQNGVAAGRDHWIRVGEPEIWSDKPRWSPDGNLLYFTSERDGFHCVWAERLDASTKRPAGPPIEIFHFHNARLSTANIGYAQLEISVAADKIVLNLGELTGNIWTLTR